MEHLFRSWSKSRIAKVIRPTYIATSFDMRSRANLIAAIESLSNDQKDTIRIKVEHETLGKPSEMAVGAEELGRVLGPLSKAQIIASTSSQYTATRTDRGTGNT